MAKRTDANHTQIIKQLRKIPGISVFSTHMVGNGFPDIVVGYKGVNYLIELKDGNKSKSRKKLTEDEKYFHLKWTGPILVAESLDDILDFIG